MSFNYQQTGLGQETDYASDYNPQLLCPLPRSQGRQELALSKDLPFQGVDVWHNYEASWLNAKGKPQVAIVQLLVPCTSIFLIESKSLKLYFNSLNFKKFNNQKEFLSLLETDLSNAAQAPIKARLLAVDNAY
ncbi:MAG TPA: NADPH-dependent 7-cyano-7-deazaguanine reductase QueF, partial [Agitococcus sp.]|nr:NADPH-dependent 7-cyano-7-deazaguanine reductase QueF [Agitococcus sp.]